MKDPIETLQTEIRRLRKEIRWHRDQVGDYRCWLDDEKLYKALPDLEAVHSAPPPEEFLKRCVEFWQHRQRPDEPLKNQLIQNSRTESLALDITNNDDDLFGMNQRELESMLTVIVNGIRQHHATAHRERRWHHDKELYLLLPEQTLACWQLPERACFMESCEHFSDSCQQEPTKLHSWE